MCDFASHCFNNKNKNNKNNKTMPSSKQQQQQQQLLLQQRQQQQQRTRAAARAYANSDISHQKQKQRQSHRPRLPPPSSSSSLSPHKSADNMPSAARKRSWAFTFVVLLVVLFVAAAGGILVWAFLPTNTKHTLQGIVNVTEDGSSSLGGNGQPQQQQQNDNSNSNNNSNNTLAPKWSFMQCQDAHTDCCNGLDDGFCDFRVNDIMYGYVHNAMASFEDDFFLLYNQNYNLEAALAAGYRALELDVARCGDDNAISFYHGQCALGTRDPSIVLDNVHTFLQENPSEIVMLFLQMDGENVSLDDFYQIMANSDGSGNSLVDLLYSHPLNATEWPTLRALVQSNQRLMIFYWNQDDCAPGAGGAGCPPGFHYYYRYGVQTLWDFSRIADVQDMGNDVVSANNAEGSNGEGNNNGGDDDESTSSSCALSYTPNYKLGQQFFRINAFLRLPSSSAAEDVLNQYNFIQERLDACSMQNPYNSSSSPTEKYYLRPNFYAVDFWEKGAVLEFIQDYNIKLLQNKQFEAANLLNVNDYELAQQDNGDGGGGDTGATDLDALLSDTNGGGRERHYQRQRLLRARQ